MAQYLLLDEHGYPSDPLDEDSDETAIAAAREYIRSWAEDLRASGELTDTCWIQAHLVEVSEDGSRREVRDFARRVEPEGATVCPAGGEHDWLGEGDLRQLTGSVGVASSGGGVSILEVCGRCGTEVVTDTWCQCAAYVWPGDPHKHTFVKIGKYRSPDVLDVEC